ncbi:HAMP domain-containing sensor histidine kinase [Rhodococcus opacus]|uniref:sensor histidine kinase n=1 Tax=Rhodococcus opacus TaxID=37919 RepID=UPI0002A28AE5|nr:HAMP domain-containing sensor histidine kinase [Rhodococcus opacus]ELB87276.1 Two component signal transduction histidine kinase [Rhodococcus wratislaviensis IFP 2016]MDX5970036.1 HAMP domain-containing sensor histidine kinase [Rhodococcus opacus]CAG7634564.1 Adaptive-response sensory-kinase SasA [Rhodococcus opacus]
MPRRSLRWGSLGLRGRVIASFAIGAALVSLVLAVSVFTISRSYMVGQREHSAQRQAATHAEFLRNLLDDPDASAPAVLGTLDPPVDTSLLLRYRGDWFGSTPGVGPDELPTGLAAAGSADTVPVDLDGQPYLAVAVPLNDRGDTLYEFAPLTELQATLLVLRIALAACALAATCGGALLGLWAARRVLTPLSQLAGTTARIAGGELDTRLPDTGDPDLATLVASFNTMVDSLEQRIDRERRFFGDVSHELRTPLTTLTTSVEVLGRHAHELPDRSRRALVLVTAELDHLRRLLDDLLALARTEAGLHQDESELVSVRALVTHTLVNSQRHPDLLTVEADSLVSVHKKALERVFLNLMNNADQHGGGLVGIGVHRDGQAAVIDFDDAGPGIAPPDRERIFERFTTAGVGRKTAGTGLGLALVAETLAAHHGRVHCTDRPGGGARFTVTLPIPAPDPDGRAT